MVEENDKNLANATRTQFSSQKRKILRQLAELITKAEDELFSRQIPEEDPFLGTYGELKVLQPAYNFHSLYRIYEESDILQACIDAMKLNVDGFGYILNYLGDDLKGQSNAIALREKIRIADFMDRCNEAESFGSVRKKVREDLEILGNGGFEMVRNRRKELQMIYAIPFKRMRISTLAGRQITVPVTLMRDGVEVTLQVKKYFRKFCQMDEYGKRSRWFKSYGDPRDMDYRTGDYGTVSAQFRATEVWHVKNEFGGAIYGMPRWIGAIMQVLGRRESTYVNYDLFKHQGIPPMLVLVSGGILSDDSIDELESILRGLRGVENFNRIGVLESTIEGLGIDDKGSAKIELKNMTDFRKEDMLFDRYLTTAKNDVRQIYRFPDLYVGQSETYTHATAKAAQTVAEEQVFIPERTDFDEKVNILIIQEEMKVKLWKYVSMGPRLVGSQEISTGIKTLAEVAALTVNHAIGVANGALGLEMSKFDAKWADYPIPIVLELVRSGRLIGIEEIAEKVEENTRLLPAPQKLLPAMTAKMFKSDIFEPDEQALYRMLVNLQSLIEQKVVGCADEITEK